LATVFGDVNLLVSNHRYTKNAYTCLLHAFCMRNILLLKFGKMAEFSLLKCVLHLQKSLLSPFFCLTFTNWNLSLIIDLNLFSKFLWTFPLLMHQLGI
jgi:hypothetical protein